MAGILPHLSEVEWLILDHLVTHGECNGAMIVKGQRVTRGSVYVTLGRLQNRGLVQSRVEAFRSGIGPAMRFYTATLNGRRMHEAFTLARRHMMNGEET